MNYSGRITIEPEKRSGQPCVRGLLFTVDDVLFLLTFMTREEFLFNFPDLAKEDIDICVAYAADPERTT